MHGRRRRAAALRRCTRERHERQGREREHLLPVRECKEHQGELRVGHRLCVPFKLGLMREEWTEKIKRSYVTDYSEM